MRQALLPTFRTVVSLSFPRLEGTPLREQPVWLEVRPVSRAKRSSGTPGAERTSLREPLPYSAQSPQLTPRLLLALWFFHWPRPVGPTKHLHNTSDKASDKTYYLF